MIGPEEIARILRTDKSDFLKMEARLSAVTGKKDVVAKIAEENETLMRDRLNIVGVPREAKAGEIYEALISKVEADDFSLFSGLGKPDFTRVADCQKVAEAAKKIANPPKGFFLKIEKAKEFLTKEPPKKVMEFLGYESVPEMLQKEDFFEVYSALRFIEGNEWLNNVFFKQYETLAPDDFEEREIQVRALSEKWAKESQKFVLKKKHNISHLKELGIVFVIPVLLGISGELLRMFSLLMHYLYEIPFYSDITRKLAGSEGDFAPSFVSLLRGDVIDMHFPDSEKSRWFIVQRYLSKDDENDWRLFAPHINPEAIHWAKAEENLSRAGEEFDGFAKELAFWKDLGWVGEHVKDESGIDVLVSFNLVDTVMSLVKQKEMVKYLYHHQEALWNKVFAEFFGPEEMERLTKENLLKGYMEI